MEMCSFIAYSVAYQYLAVIFFTYHLERSNNCHGNRSICVLITKSCSGKFTYALPKKTWRCRSSSRGRNAEWVWADFLQRMACLCGAGGAGFRLVLLISWHLVQEDLQSKLYCYHNNCLFALLLL